MFVYLKEPMGRRTIGNKEVHGRCYNYGRLGPVRLTYKEWLEHKDILEEVYVTKKLAAKLLNLNIPDVTFKASECSKLSDALALQLADALGVPYHFEDDWPPERVRHKMMQLKDRLKMVL